MSKQSIKDKSVIRKIKRVSTVNIGRGKKKRRVLGDLKKRF